jgi:hypothetical protein
VRKVFVRIRIERKSKLPIVKRKQKTGLRGGENEGVPGYGWGNKNQLAQILGQFLIILGLPENNHAKRQVGLDFGFVVWSAVCPHVCLLSDYQKVKAHY